MVSLTPGCANKGKKNKDNKHRMLGTRMPFGEFVYFISYIL